MPPLSQTWVTCDITYLNSFLLTLKPCRKSEFCFVQISNSRGSSSEGDSVGMKGNFPRQNKPQSPIQPPESVRTPQNPPDVQTIQRECFLSMKEMFDQFVMNLKKEEPIAQVVASTSRAPIEKLLQHRAYPFDVTIKVKPEEAEYWLEHITQIFTKQLSCLDEHKLECSVAFLIDEALSWWETTTLSVPAEKITLEFFMVEFKKKYIGEQHFEETRKKFFYPNQALINDDRPQWKSKKAKYHHENPISYTPVSRSNFTPRPPNDIKLAIPTDSVNNERNLGKTIPCKFFQKWHWGRCRIPYNLCYACGGDDHFIRDCPRNIQKVLAQPPAESSFTPLIRNESSKQVQYGNQGRDKGNLKTSTHQESRNSVRVYHAEERDDEKSLEIITEELVKILDWDIKRLRNKSVALVKVLWKNHGVEEVTWETEAAMQEQYPHLFYSGKNSRTNSLLRGDFYTIK
ncbi:hypothetical protein GQ457_04G018440 [Hibiscus cannabinus]